MKLADAVSLLKSAAIEEPAKEAEEIFRFITKADKASFYLDPPEVDDDVAGPLLARRLAREPLQYILGSVEFLELTISVGPGVLIPRPETEILAETAIRLASERLARQADILDLCTGSGCIACALASALRYAHVTGVDVSAEAIAYANRNRAINGLDNVEFLVGDLYSPVCGNTYDLIVSNPPYILEGDIDALPLEISRYEPREALSGRADGLHYYKEILSRAHEFMKPDSMIILEAGYGQAMDIECIARAAGFQHIEFKKDYAHIDRIAIIWKS